MILEEEGVFGYCELDQFDLDLVTLDTDILSLELPEFFRSFFLVRTLSLAAVNPLTPMDPIKGPGQSVDPDQMLQNVASDQSTLFALKTGISVKNKAGRPVARLDVHPSGIQTVMSSILQSGKTFFRGDWSNHFCSHCLPTAESSTAVVSYWRKVLVNRLCLSLPRKSVVRLTDWLDMTIVVDWAH